ncbi:MAG TPA: trypsin-like peptidase domain-containing protein [bacterium]|nr:trypsin-like peptidase domain-containing protein [bacterium]
MMRFVACLSCILILCVGIGAPDSQAQITTGVIDFGLARAVMIGILVRDAQGNLKEYSQCSASFITPKGMILSASHCVRADSDIPRYNVVKGQLYNPEGWATVYLNVPNQIKPVLTLFARLVADVRDPLDLALLRTERLAGTAGERPLPSDFSVPHLAIANPDSMRHGDPIVLIGFPSVGGDTVTVARGHVTGFTADAQGRKLEMKTDVGAPGFSGAPVINERGEQVAVHTSSQVEPDRAARSGRATLSNRIPSEWAAHLAQTQSGSPQPAPAPAGQTTAILQGRIVDVSSGAGLTGVGVWILTPGTSFAEATNASVVASALTDGNGFFQARPSVTRGFTYPIIVLANGYQRLTGFVEVPKLTAQGAPGTAEVANAGTIALTRQ